MWQTQLRDNLVQNLLHQIQKEDEKNKLPMTNLIEHMRMRFPDMAWMQAIAATLDYDDSNPIFQPPRVQAAHRHEAFNGALGGVGRQGNMNEEAMLMLPTNIVNAFTHAAVPIKSKGKMNNFASRLVSQEDRTKLRISKMEEQQRKLDDAAADYEVLKFEHDLWKKREQQTAMQLALTKQEAKKKEAKEA